MEVDTVFGNQTRGALTRRLQLTSGALLARAAVTVTHAGAVRSDSRPVFGAEVVLPLPAA